MCIFYLFFSYVKIIINIQKKKKTIVILFILYIKYGKRTLNLK